MRIHVEQEAHPTATTGTGASAQESEDKEAEIQFGEDVDMPKRRNLYGNKGLENIVFHNYIAFTMNFITFWICRNVVRQNWQYSYKNLNTFEN